MMAKTVPVVARVAPEVKERLRAIARIVRRSEALLAREAIEQFVEANDWQIRLIEGRLAEARTGGETVSHDEVERWLDAKGAAQELPNPGRGL
jgi:predicted transcriptional regulator